MLTSRAARAITWLALALALPLLAGCQRGCAREWLAGRGGGDRPGHPAGRENLNAIDCPDGLARCRAGQVETSRSASIPQPCRGSAEGCQCPWEAAGECPHGCAAEDIEVVIARGSAATQLCAPAASAGLTVTPPVDAVPSGCDEGDAYRCVRGLVVWCRDNAVVAQCAQGCAVEPSALGDDPAIGREAAFAILCTR